VLFLAPYGKIHNFLRLLAFRLSTSCGFLRLDFQLLAFRILAGKPQKEDIFTSCGGLHVLARQELLVPLLARALFLGCTVPRAACTCPTGLGSQGKGKCNHIGGVLALEDFTRRGLQKHPEPLSCSSRLLVWVAPRKQSNAGRPLDQILIRKN